MSCVKRIIMVEIGRWGSHDMSPRTYRSANSAAWAWARITSEKILRNKYYNKPCDLGHVEYQERLAVIRTKAHSRCFPIFKEIFGDEEFINMDRLHLMIQATQTYAKLRKDLDMLRGFQNMDTVEHLEAADVHISNAIRSLNKAIETEKNG